MAGNKTKTEEKEKLGVYLSQEVAQALRAAAEENRRTISGQVEVMIINSLAQPHPRKETITEHAPAIGAIIPNGDVSDCEAEHEPTWAQSLD